MERGLKLVDQIPWTLKPEHDVESIRSYFEANEYGLAMDMLNELIESGLQLKGLAMDDFIRIEGLMKEVAELYEKGA